MGSHDDLFIRGPDDTKLQSLGTGAVDLGCPIPSPALLLSLNSLSTSWWNHLGNEDKWRARWNLCGDKVQEDARIEVQNMFKDANAKKASKMSTLQKFAESPALCALMEDMHTPELGTSVAVDTSLSQGLAVRNASVSERHAGHCHEVVVSSLDHEIKSVTGYPVEWLVCYPREGQPSCSWVAVGGVCLKITGSLGDTFTPRVPGKLVIYRSKHMKPWAALLCFVGIANTALMIIFLVVTPQSPAFWFLMANVATEVLAIVVGWKLKHRWAMGWKEWLVILDPFHALLTADRRCRTRVAFILALEAVGGVAGITGLLFTEGVPLEFLSTVVIPVFCFVLAKFESKEKGVRTSLILTAMSLYLLEFLYEIAVVYLFDDSVLGWVVIVSCVVESVALAWMIGSVVFALHFLNGIKPGRPTDDFDIPARLRDGTMTAFDFPDLPRNGLMVTSARGSSGWPGRRIRQGASFIKEGSDSFGGWHGRAEPPPIVDGWVSLSTCDLPSPLHPKGDVELDGTHTWLSDIVVFCGVAIPIL